MAQHDQVIDNGSGAAVRADINSALAALFSLSSGASEPSTTVAHQLWADTTNGLLKRRNAADSGWIPVGPLSSTMVQSKSAGYTVALGDFGTLIDCTATLTLALTAAATLGDGFWCEVRNSGSGTVTIDPNSTEQIDGNSTIALSPGESCGVWCTGSAFKTIGRAAPVAGTGMTASGATLSVDKATQANMEAQTADKVVTADNAKWHPGMPKAWVKFHWSGSAIVVDASYGVSGVVRNGTGDYTVSFSTAFSSANYGALVSAGTSSAPASTTALVGAQAAGSCVVYGISNGGASMADPNFMYAAFFGDQ